jgi:hypothetical protein
MKPVPPRSLETAVGFLIPPACREEVLGDLHERFTGLGHYVRDAVFTVPLVIASRIRRTTDPAVILMEALAMYLSFLMAAWYLDRPSLSDPSGLWRLAIPVVAMVLALALRDVCATPGIRLRWEAVLRPALGAGCALLVSPSWLVLLGSMLSILTVAPLRVMFPPAADLPQGAAGPPFWQRYVAGSVERPAVAIVAAVVLLVGLLLLVAPTT